MNLLDKYLVKQDFNSYEDFMANFSIKKPDNFNFAYDVVGYYADVEPEKVALVWCNDDDCKKTITFRDLDVMSNRVANMLLSLGIVKGDSIMLILKSRYEFWYMILALHKIGAVGIPATHMLTTKDIKYRIKEADVKMIISVSDNDLPQFTDDAQKYLGNILKFKMLLNGKRAGWLSFYEELDKAGEDFVRPVGKQATKNEDLMLIYFSSGTVGFPKMVKLDFLYPLGHIITAKYWQNVIDGKLHYTVADTGWAKCVWGKLYGQWISGAVVFVYDYSVFDIRNMIDKAIEYNVATFCAPPTIYRFLIKEDLSGYDFSCLKYAVVAGEPLNPEVYNKFFELTGLKLMEGYGQTELVITIATFPWMQPKPGSMGKSSSWLKADLMDRDSGKLLDVGEQGEIVVDVSDGFPIGMFKGYHKDEQLTDSVIHDGYYYTGDLAWKDEDGYFWFVGRADDVIKTSGYRVGPFEVENALMEHPSVLECAITGVPDEIRGQVIKATIVLAKGFEASTELKKHIQNHVKEVTAPYKYPRVIEFVKNLPKTISGKIRRVEIREDG